MSVIGLRQDRRQAVARMAWLASLAWAPQGPALASPMVEAFDQWVVPADPPPAQAWVTPGAPKAQDFWTQPRDLWLHRSGLAPLHLIYWRDGALDPDGYRSACLFLRDLGFEALIRRQDPRVLAAVKSGRLPQEIPVTHAMDPRVLDALYAIGAWLRHFGVSRPIEVLSAYRHWFYNANVVEGAARQSFHIQGRAVDVRIHGVSPQRIAQFSKWLGAGGVGLYVANGFTHIDTGPMRAWGG